MSTPDDANPSPGQSQERNQIRDPSPTNVPANPPEEETPPPRPETPASQWSDDRISSKFYESFTRAELETILTHGAAGLWEILQQSGWLDQWSLYQDACAKFFPNWCSMTRSEAGKLAKASYIAQMQATRAPRTLPPPTYSPYGREDPKTPRGPRVSRPASLPPVPGSSTQGQDPDFPMGSAPPADQSPDDPFVESPEAKAESIAKRINGLLWTLHRMIAAFPPEAKNSIWTSIQIPNAGVSDKRPEGSTGNPLLARTPPMPPQRNRSRRGRSKATKPLIARLSSPHAEAGPSTSFANVAKRTPEQLLVQAKSIVKTAPETSIHEAMKIAESLPIALPRKKAPTLATVQGTKTSMTITATEVLIPGPMLRRLVDAAGLDPVLSTLQSRLVTLSVDGYCAVLRSNVSITDEQRHAWRALVARTLNQPLETTAIRDRATHSTAKIEFLPKTTDVTPEAIHQALLTIPLYRDNHVATDPVTLVPHPKNNTVLTAVVKIYDDRAGHLLKSLIKKNIFVGGANRRLRAWINKPAARQCIVCQRWGHTQQICGSRSPFCATCAGPHPTVTHFTDCELCHQAGHDPVNCTHVKCINCNGPHVANSQECEWYKARGNSEALEALEKRKKNVIEAVRQARTARRLPTASGSNPRRPTWHQAPLPPHQHSGDEGDAQYSTPRDD